MAADNVAGWRRVSLAPLLVSQANVPACTAHSEPLAHHYSYLHAPDPSYSKKERVTASTTAGQKVGVGVGPCPSLARNYYKKAPSPCPDLWPTLPPARGRWGMFPVGWGSPQPLPCQSGLGWPEKACTGCMAQRMARVGQVIAQQ